MCAPVTAECPRGNLKHRSDSRFDSVWRDRHVCGAGQAAGAGDAGGAARGQQPVLHPGLPSRAGLLWPGRRPTPPHLGRRLCRAHALPLGASAGALLLPHPAGVSRVVTKIVTRINRNLEAYKMGQICGVFYSFYRKLRREPGIANQNYQTVGLWFTFQAFARS